MLASLSVKLQNGFWAPEVSERPPSGQLSITSVDRAQSCPEGHLLAPAVPPACLALTQSPEHTVPEPGLAALHTAPWGLPGRSMFPSKVNQVLAGFPPRKSVGLTALCWLPPSPPRLQERRAPWGGCSSYLCTLAQHVPAASPAVAVEAVSLRALMPLPLEVLVEVEIKQPRLPVTEPSRHTGIYPLSRSDHPT